MVDTLYAQIDRFTSLIVASGMHLRTIKYDRSRQIAFIGGQR